MKYEEGTGEYESTFMEQIYTDSQDIILSDIPYKVDRGIYEDVFGKYGEEVRVKDADVVRFHASMHTADDEDEERWVFFVWPENSPEGSEDFYECVFFDGKKDYAQFLSEFKHCIIGVDKEYGEKMKDRMLADVRDRMNDICLLCDVL